MPLTSFVSALALGVVTLGLLPTGGPLSTDTDFDGQFETGHLNVSGERLAPTPFHPDGRPMTNQEWATAWEDYTDYLAEACRAEFEDPSMARCDVFVVDNRDRPSEDDAIAVTIHDLAQFTPTVGELVVEPDGWGVVGTPTNFYATAEAHTVLGSLFDTPIRVHWTPSSYIFDYGDGTTEQTDAGGQPWHGEQESWTETATSHVYRSRDDRTASLTVVFTAEVDAGGGWFAVPGTLPIQAPPEPVQLFEVHSVLTSGDCIQQPDAPGCG